MDLFIIRHGQATGNIVSYDVPDGELTELGRSQAGRVAECLTDTGIAHIVCSPLIRAIETAQPLAQRLRLSIQVWKDVYEVRDKGFYRGPTAEELNRLFPETVFRNEMEADGWQCAGNETWEMGLGRAQRIWAELVSTFSGQRVALFGHGGFNRVLLFAALGIGHASNIRFEESNGSFFWLHVDGERVTVKYIGETQRIG